jgi:hypothetical protein
MNLTPDTKLSELIPEGYEILDEAYGITSGKAYNIANYIDNISILITKPKSKFLKYAESYVMICHVLVMTPNNLKAILEWSFEAKIGLLKYICENIPVKVYWLNVLNEFSFKRGKLIHSNPSDKNNELILNVIPKEFIESILKE